MEKYYKKICSYGTKDNGRFARTLEASCRKRLCRWWSWSQTSWKVSVTCGEYFLLSQFLNAIFNFFYHNLSATKMPFHASVILPISRISHKSLTFSIPVTVPQAIASKPKLHNSARATLILPSILWAPHNLEPPWIFLILSRMLHYDHVCIQKTP